MDSGTLSDATFGAYAKANFELVKLDKAADAGEFEKLGITSLPAVVVLGSDGEEIARIKGDPGPAELQAQLEAALAKLTDEGA